MVKEMETATDDPLAEARAKRAGACWANGRGKCAVCGEEKVQRLVVISELGHAVEACKDCIGGWGCEEDVGENEMNAGTKRTPWHLCSDQNVCEMCGARKCGEHWGESETSAICGVCEAKIKVESWEEHVKELESQAWEAAMTKREKREEGEIVPGEGAGVVADVVEDKGITHGPVEERLHLFATRTASLQFEAWKARFLEQRAKNVSGGIWPSVE